MIASAISSGLATAEVKANRRMEAGEKGRINTHFGEAIQPFGEHTAAAQRTDIAGGAAKRVGQHRQVNFVIMGEADNIAGVVKLHCCQRIGGPTHHEFMGMGKRAWVAKALRASSTSV